MRLRAIQWNSRMIIPFYVAQMTRCDGDNKTVQFYEGRDQRLPSNYAGRSCSAKLPVSHILVWNTHLWRILLDLITVEHNLFIVISICKIEMWWDACYGWSGRSELFPVDKLRNDQKYEDALTTLLTPSGCHGDLHVADWIGKNESKSKTLFILSSITYCM